jgi:hypothetical protein
VFRSSNIALFVYTDVVGPWTDRTILRIGQMEGLTDRWCLLAKRSRTCYLNCLSGDVLFNFDPAIFEVWDSSNQLRPTCL